MISIDLTKAKNIAHEVRRADRDAKMAPLDIKATIPSEATTAETERQVIRTANADIQVAIEVASSVEQIKTALEQL